MERVMNATSIESTDGNAEITFTSAGPAVRVIVNTFDPFEEGADVQVDLGDFNLEVLRHRLAGLGATPVGSVPLPRPRPANYIEKAQARPGRRKPRWWTR
jgi:hypothetical protein